MHVSSCVLRRLAVTGIVGGLTGALLLVGASPSARPDPVAQASGATAPVGLVLVAAHPGHPAAGHPWHGHPGRWILPHYVHRGETATGLAVRYHAWTHELMAVNHLRNRSVLYVGERVLIPVVLSSWRRHHRPHHRPRHHHHRPRHHHHGHHHAHHAGHHHAHHAGHHHGHHHGHRGHPHRHHVHHPWRNADASRTQVRHTLVRTAHRAHVDPYLALAIAWNESGWQQHVISSAHAVGVMQVLPSTGRWMSGYVGRPLNVYGMYDNVTAGVVLVKVLRSQTGPKRAIGAYYQGLGSIQRYGMYDSTKHYVATVRAIRHRLADGWRP